MTATEYIELRKSHIDKFATAVRGQLNSGDQISVLVVAAAIEAFGAGFDAATKHYQDPPTPQPKETK